MKRREGTEEPLRVGVDRVPEDLRRGRGLDDLARVHDRDPVAELDHQREVVRDEQDREADLRLELLDLRQDLALHDDVERGRRLVHDHQLGAKRERHRDDDALPHPARELVRVGAEPVRVDADEVEQFGRPIGAPARLVTRSCAVIASAIWSPIVITGLSAFIALWKTIETRFQRNASIAGAVHLQDVVAPEEDLAAGDDRRRPQDPHDRLRDRRLAAARLAGEAEDLAVGDGERDAVDRDGVAATGDVLHVQVADVEDRTGRHGGAGGRHRGQGGHQCALGTTGVARTLLLGSPRMSLAIFRSAPRRGLVTSSIP